MKRNSESRSLGSFKKRRTVQSSDEESEGSSDEDQMNGSSQQNLQPINTGEGVIPKKGSIVRVKLHNFVTYDDVEFFPGPLLNLVIGPNGTGKSTIVCAFCLGLAGSTSILGRAKEVKDYIKTGAEEGYVELELFNIPPKKNIIIRRELRRIDNKSIWKLNGEKVSEQIVKQALSKLNMQIENLCQFLPQDRVADFAKLDPMALLLETEKAVAEKLNLMHKNLIELRKKQKEKNSSYEIQKKHLEDLVEKNKTLERDVEKFRAREKQLNHIELLNFKRPWLIFEEQRLKTLSIRTKFEKAKEAYDREHDLQAPFLQKFNEYEKEVRVCEKKCHESSDILKRIDQKRKSLISQNDQLDHESDKIQKELESLTERERENQEKREKIKNAIERIKNQLSQLSDPSEINEQLALIQQEEERATKQRAELRKEKITLSESKGDLQKKLNQTINKLSDLNNLRKQRIELLKRDNDTYSAYRWIQDNPHQFRKPILGPVSLEINVPNPLHANYLEQHLPTWLRTAFITQTNEDTDTLLNWMKQSNKKVAYVFVENEQNRVDHPCDISKIERLGFTKWLDDVFDAPKIVKDALRSCSRVHEVACGNDSSVHHLDEMAELSQEYRIHIYYTPQSRFQAKRSKYGSKNVSISVVSVRPAKIFTGIDLDQIRVLEQESNRIRNELNQISQKESQINQQDTELSKVFQKKNGVSEQKREIERRAKSYKSSIQFQEKELETLDRRNVQDEENKLRQNLKDISIKRVKNVSLITKEIVKLTEQSFIHDILVIEQVRKRITYHHMIIEKNHLTEKLSNLGQEQDNAQMEFENAKREAKRLKDEADKVCALDENRKAQFQKLPNTISEIDEQISELEATVQGNQSDDPGVLEQYEKRKEQIETLENKLQNDGKSVEVQKVEIEKIKREWLPLLKEIVQRINKSFSEHFRAIGCVGEVRLDEFGDDFDQYCISIWVKFRESESLQRLTAHHQSGGERSVSTMLYLLSLQDLTPSPFRLVDEINQGMDPNNERMIFKLVSNKTCVPGSSQYFLITPKLLTNLEYSTQMSILCVFNGPWMVPQQGS